METALLVILTALVAILATLLVLRHLRERREARLLSRMTLSASGGADCGPGEPAFEEISRRLFDILRDVCECRRLICLLRGNAYLELKRTHGLEMFDAETMVLPCTPDLVAFFTRSPALGDVEQLKAVLPESASKKLRELGLDLFLPLTAQGQLHGIYFMSGNGLIHSPRVRFVLASIAQAVSAGEYVRLIDAERGKLRDRVREMESNDRKKQGGHSSGGMLKLVRHRDSETLVERIIDEVSGDLDIKRYVFLYRHNGDKDHIRILQNGLNAVAQTPQHEDLDRLISRLAPDKLEEVAGLPNSETDGNPLVSSLQASGLKYAAEFPLSAAQSGLLVFDSERPPDEVISVLRGHGRAAAELVANAESFAEVEALSYTDGLTGLANQRYFKKRLDEEIGRAGRYGRTLGLIIFDLDELKAVNDRYGHQAGDTIIEQMGQLLKSSTRAIDVVARYGGDEFCIIMPESDKAMCTHFMERLHRKVSSTSFRLDQLDKEIHCTISVGGAVFPEHGDTPEKLVYAADMALLRAKEGGRDRHLLSE